MMLAIEAFCHASTLQNVVSDEDEDWWCELFESSGYVVEKLRHEVEGIKQSALPLHKKGNCQFVLKPQAADRRV